MEHYERKVFYSRDDGGWIAIAPELPGCSAFGESPEAALQELEVVMEGWLEVAKEIRRPTPQPIADQDLQGRILLRVPKTLQKELKRDAAQEGVSVNQYAVYLLSKARAEAHPRAGGLVADRRALRAVIGKKRAVKRKFGRSKN